MQDILSPKLLKMRGQMDELAKEIHNLTNLINHEELSKIISDLRIRINEPFMFVIVGEVKAGKSSFINALLNAEKEVAKVAPQPMTDTIQQIVFGEVEEIIYINPFLKKITLPLNILKDIAIVDTPGTNTIIENHQKITESFIPGSDLIVFVFESKNPYRQSAWDFLKFIKVDWYKKIIFVMQQKDLLSSEDLKVNSEGVRLQAEKYGILNPIVFEVSAKEELEKKVDVSGFQEVRKYISENITGGKAPFLKIQNNAETLQNIKEKLDAGLVLRQNQFMLDVEFRKNITQSLNDQEERSNIQANILVENIVNAYDNETNQVKDKLRNGLNFFTLLKKSVAGIFNKGNDLKSWLNEVAINLDKDLNAALRKRLDQGIGALADSIQQMAKIIQLKVQNSETLLKNNHEIFSDIAEKRSFIMQDLQNKFNEFLSQSENFYDKSLFPEQTNISSNIAAGGGVAVIGIILAAVTKLAVFDITGGLLTAVGLVFAGATTIFKRQALTQKFEQEINLGRIKLEQEVAEQLKKYIFYLRTKIEDNFGHFDAMQTNEADQLKKLEVAFEICNQNFERLTNEIKNYHI